MNVHEYTQQENRGIKRRLQNAFLNKRIRYAALAGTVMLILIISLSVSLAGRKNSKSMNGSYNGPRMPTAEVSEKVHQTNREEMGAFLATLYNELSISMHDLTEEGSPPYLAVQWLTGRDEFTGYTSKLRTQRFVLATFYYATFMKSHEFKTDPTDWTSQENWLTDADECEWEGVGCNSDLSVVAILLPSHALSGSLPTELAFLPHVAEFDFTTNFLLMADASHNVWHRLVNLQILLLEDNFIVTENGLPEGFARLNKLQKVQMSYNLLQGEISEEVMTGMTSLQHFEVESNYLTGALPEAMGSLSNLVYIYARRNLLQVSLDNMFPPDVSVYPALFSLWIDNNEVTGSIPTTIGQILGLASLSMTNTTLTGSIPTELGLLTNLKRVWLYENNLTGNIPIQLASLNQLEVFEVHTNPSLTGSIPATVCSAVASSTYELAALTADCATVSCEGCCTQCY